MGNKNQEKHIIQKMAGVPKQIMIITLAKDPTIFVYIATDTSSKCQCIQLLYL